MADLVTGYTFVNGPGAVTAERLNAALNSATIQKEFFSGKATITPVAADKLLFLDVSGNVLGICTLTSLITAMAGVTSGTLAAGNDTRFSASVTGIRLGAGAGADTSAKPKDFAKAPTAAVLSAGSVDLDCSLNNTFTVPFDANGAINLKNISDGDKIRIQVTQDATGSRELTLTSSQTIWYEGNSAYALSTAPNAVDFLFFHRVGNNLLTWVRKDFGP